MGMLLGKGYAEQTHGQKTKDTRFSSYVAEFNAFLLHNSSQIALES